MTSPDDFPEARPRDLPGYRPSSFDEWLQAFKEQASVLLHRREARCGDGHGYWRCASRGNWPRCCRCCPSSALRVGLAAGLVFAIVRGIGGPGWLAAALAVGASALITRALHEDGLAGIPPTGWGRTRLEPPRRLEIMRDSRNGTFGVLALVLSALD